MIIKRLYDSVLRWAKTKNAPHVLSIVSFTEASLFPVPPDPILLTLCLGKPEKSFRFAFLCSVFSVLGACMGYLIGMTLWESVHGFFFSYLIDPHSFQKVGNMYRENAFIAILGAAFTPIPFKAFTLGAGVFNVSLTKLIYASILGRSARFFLEASLIFYYGERIENFINKYFNLLTFILFVLIVALIILFRH